LLDILEAQLGQARIFYGAGTNQKSETMVTCYQFHVPQFDS